MRRPLTIEVQGLRGLCGIATCHERPEAAPYAKAKAAFKAECDARLAKNPYDQGCLSAYAHINAIYAKRGYVCEGSDLHETLVQYGDTGLKTKKCGPDECSSTGMQPPPTDKKLTAAEQKALDKADFATKLKEYTPYLILGGAGVVMLGGFLWWRSGRKAKAKTAPVAGLKRRRQ